ncbi:harpin HrpZ family protein [Marinomonas lutimaris]|jgi:hypothetical protein|uniref:harpin HrpZ family protein n=1 Tax=Marinomonas lutimaris TaxID=2846746 RepID=UPI001CA50D0A|nr:harpin HrpZ family protein [Marinomonas lutimaris]
MIEAKLTISIPLNQSGGFMAGQGVGGGSNKGIADFNKPTGNNSPNQGADALVGMLADLLIDSLLQKKGDGATFNNAGNNPMMDMIAKFMDQNASKYNGPHDATGNVRNWQDEMSEDNYLSGSELKDFTSGLKDALSTAITGGLQQILGGIGGSMGGLGGLAGGMAGSVLGSVGGPLGSAVGGMVGDTLGGALGGMAGGAMGGLGNAIGGLGGSGFGGVGGFGGAGFGSSSIGNSGIGGGLGLGDMSPASRNGFSMGGDFVSHLGKTAVDSIDIKESGFRSSEKNSSHGGERFSFSKEDKDMAKDIGKFMDQHTDKFGEQPRGGWASRIERGKDFNSEEIGRFKQAMEAVKGVMEGKSTGDQQIDMDAMMLSNAIVNEAMHKVSK